MRIVLTAYDRANYTAGPIINARRLLTCWKRLGHDVHAFIPYEEYAPNAKWISEQGIPCHTVDLQKQGHAVEPLVEWMLHRLQKIQPDVFIPNISVAGGYAARWARESGITTIMTCRGQSPLNTANAAFFGEKQSDWAVSGLVFVNRFLESSYLDQVAYPVPRAIIASGVPVPETMADQQAPGLNMVYAGRLEQNEKRIRDLVDSFIYAADEMPESALSLVGSGSEKDTLEKKIAAAGMAGRIRIVDPLANPAYHQFLMQHHVIVLMSDNEGMPGSLMDGMACGLVPVSLHTKGIEDLVVTGQNGFVLQNREKDFLAALRRLESDPALRQRMGTAARRHIEENYSIASTADKWITFLSELRRQAPEKRPLDIPARLDLPPPNPDFGTEDLRRPGPPNQPPVSRWKKLFMRRTNKP